MDELAAEGLKKDPRVLEAKRLLQEALEHFQKKMGGVREADPARQKSYAETLQRFATERGAALYYPYLGSGLGKGPLVELEDGSVKYDFITGIGVHYMGHNHPALLTAGVDAALENTVMQGNLQQNGNSEALLREFLAAANRKGAELAHGFLTSSGAMANENALKIVMQKNSPANRILAFNHCFAGRTLVLSQITDKPQYRQGLPETVSVDYVPFFDPKRPSESISKASIILKSHLARYPKAHACMIFELIQGEGGGYLPGDGEFFRSLMKILKSAGVAVFVDEIQTFGRTSEYFAFQYFGLDAFVDIVTLGKLSQTCATLIKADFKPKSGLVSQTFTAPSISIHSARIILRYMDEQGLLGADGKIMQLSNYFRDRLKAFAAKNPNLVEGPYGLGGMIAFTPLGGSTEKVTAFLKKLFDAGVIGFIAGENPARARFLLPVGSTEISDIDAAFNIIEKVLLEMS